jgi:hypothetical protein
MGANGKPTNDAASIGKRQVWMRPVLRRLDVQGAETGIFIGPELITELS